MAVHICMLGDKIYYVNIISFGEICLIEYKCAIFITILGADFSSNRTLLEVYFLIMSFYPP